MALSSSNSGWESPDNEKKWKAAAKAGTARPVLLFEFKPTVLYAEKNFRGDWSQGTSLSNLDTGHDTDELRLGPAVVEHPDSQTDQSGKRSYYEPVYRRRRYEGPLRDWSVYRKASLVQTFKVVRAFRLQKLYLGIRNEYAKDYEKYFSTVMVRLLRGLREPTKMYNPGSIEGIVEKAREIISYEIDFQQEYETVADNDGYWHVIDFSQENVWIPGGNEPCAITLEPATDENLGALRFFGSEADSYAKGDLYKADASTGVFVKVPGDLAFKLIGDGYAATGSGTWTFVLDQAPQSSLSGEIELRYSEPAGTALSFYLRQGNTLSEAESQSWSAVSDGASVSKRLVQIKPVFRSDADQLDSPRIYSMRVAFKRSEKFLLAARPLFGYPNCVAEAPDYSAEGEPLSGEASATDTSRILMLDPDSMVSNLFSISSLKNDEISIKLGFDTEDFRESDFLPFKTIWIEDWEPAEGAMSVHGYDQQVRYREAEAPACVAPPEMSEEIHYDLQNPADIKRDLLQRARIRPSSIDPVSFGKLAENFDWQLTYEITKPGKLQKVDRELNRHLLAFQVIDETGKWVTRYADFEAAPAASLSGNDILAGSERYYPGLKYLRNYATVFFGGEGRNESDYAGIAISCNDTRESEKAFKELAVDKLFSEFIPPSDDADDVSGGIARQVAGRRRMLQENGLRVVEFSTRLEFAYLQIGDHIHFTSTHYKRAGAVSPNPLLVLLTRKNIDRSLRAIHWAGLVLLDNEESPEADSPVAAPRNFNVTVNGNGTVTWFWSKSLDDDGSDIKRYDLYQRLSHLDAWGPPKTSITATGASSYYHEDSDFSEPVAYDFGVRAVHENGRASAMVTDDNLLVTWQAPAVPGWDDWELNPVPGGIEVWVCNQVSGAAGYNVYTWKNGRWEPAGSFSANLRRSQAFVLQAENQFLRKLHKITIAAVNNWGVLGEKASARGMINYEIMDSTRVLSAPSFDSAGGTYPLISRVAVGPHFAFSITLKITAPQGEEDLADRYELQRRDDGGEGQTNWSGWERLPDYRVKQEDSSLPAPATFYYDNTDRKFKPSWYYQYRVRAVGRNNVPGAWSSPVTLQLTEDTTPPAQPTITVKSLIGTNRIYISEPADPDFAYFKIEGKEAGGSWEVLAPHYRGTTYHHMVDDIELETDWQYRVTAYDHSGNPSTVSATSTAKAQKKAGEIYLSGSVNDTLAQVSVNEADIELRVEKSGVISAINISTEGIDIQGDNITINGDTVFSSDCEIYGNLKLTKTSNNDNRIEIGSFSGDEEFRLYDQGYLSVQRRGLRLSVGFIRLVACPARRRLCLHSAEVCRPR